MASERAITTRQREQGRLCALCHLRLDPPAWPRERLCDRCDFHRPRHPVLLNFQQQPQGWTAHFIAADARTPLSRHYDLGPLESLRRLIERTDPPAAVLQDFDHQARQWGRGSLNLTLTEAQLRQLKR